MSVVSFIEKLLDGDEVEWISLEDIAHFQNAKPHEKLVSPDGDIALLTSKFISTEGKSARWINKADVLTPALENDVALVMSDLPNGRALAKAFFVTENDRYAANQRVCLLRVKDAECYSPKLLYYVMNRNRQLLAYDSGYDQTHLKKDWILQVKIPIPCPNNPKKSLEIQAEIVRILDAFTAMTAELTTELTARKKQYNYYRDQLLSFEEGEVEWKTLGELAENLDSKRKPITSGLRDVGKIPYYGASGIVDYVKDYIFDGDFLLVSEDGANLLARNTPIAFSISGKTWVNNHAHVLKFDTYAERRYVEYYLNSIDLTPYITGAAQPKLNKKNLESILIPNPSLLEKERIVSILDKFDALTSSITEGLPREIELRQKQYEYYRDLLLSFPKPFSEVVV